MKKTLITITLLCVALTLHALDYRQVIFGNAYENIIEINADDFFEQYPEVKELYRADYFRSFSEHEREEIEALPNYYRVYEQVIGDDTFFRLLISFDRYSDADLLNWKDIFFTQYVFYKESEKELLQLDDMYLFGKENIAMDSQYVYEGLEIIERNSTVIGLMRHQLSDYNQIENFAYYCTWEEAKKSYIQKTDTIWYVHWNLKRKKNFSVAESVHLSIIAENNAGERVAGSVLVDTKRPFMYTIQNAFDGKSATSFVEDTYNDLFTILFEMNRTVDLTALKIINGYADREYYYENNRIANIYSYTDVFTELNETYSAQLVDLNITKKSFFFLDFSKVYQGSKYNDTALAEFDLYVADEGWLFGGLK